MGGFQQLKAQCYIYCCNGEPEKLFKKVETICSFYEMIQNAISLLQ